MGTVAPGRLADLVLPDASPLDDIHNTRKIFGAVRNGRCSSIPAHLRPDPRQTDRIRCAAAV